jgi:hypothetical protein
VFVRGQVNDDDQTNLSDALAILNYLFLAGDTPRCLKAADANDDGSVNISDAVYLLGHLFLGGSPIPPPFPTPGPDPTPDELPCAGGSVSDLTAMPSLLTLGSVGRTAQLSVTGRVGGEILDLHSGTSGTTYEPSNPLVIGVYRDGLVEARAQGNATVAVRNGAAGTTVAVMVTAPGGSPLHRVLAVNDLGMHCMDREFQVFTILPPFNVIHAQVARAEAGGSVSLLGDDEVEVRYSSIADATGSENSRSLGKTLFWEAAAALFGSAVPPGQGLLGSYMPGDAPDAGPQPFVYEAARGWFTAAGVPITPTDDAGAHNPYPLLRVAAFDRTTGEPLAHIDAVVPVSQEVDCRTCHATGEIAARAGYLRWSRDPDIEVATKTNILSLHDYRSHTGLVRSKPVLCARCHYSAALDLAGKGPSEEQSLHASLSRAMHSFHGVQVDEGGAPLFPEGAPPEQTCYNCHPGKQTQCQRGAMRTGGMECASCHGEMLAVGATQPLAPGGSLDGSNDGKPRRPWMDLPRCQSCHTGDAAAHLSGPEYEAAADGIRLRRAFRLGDGSASPILAANKRFAEPNATLYRFSRGHGGVLCSGCHGSPHAEWPNADPAHNDNIAASQIQGHSGAVAECTACHAPGATSLSLGGPHGLHPVNDLRWIKGRHGSVYETKAAECRACHGLDLKGSVLSRAAADRLFRIEDDLIVGIAKGTAIGCDRCHAWPRQEDD